MAFYVQLDSMNTTEQVDTTKTSSDEAPKECLNDTGKKLMNSEIKD